MVVTDETTSVSSSAGIWCLPNAPFIAHTSLFNEIIEYRGPCVTDFGAVEFRNPQYRTAAGWFNHTSAFGHYNGNNSSVDADCADANLRRIAPDHVADERVTSRGQGGGLLADGFLWGP